MGNKPVNRRNLNEMKIITEFARLKVIDLNSKIKRNLNLIRVSEIFFDFIHHRKVGSLKNFFVIFIKIIEVIQIILEKRKTHDYKLFFVNFDKFWLDINQNLVIYEDVESLSKNFEYNFFITDDFISDKSSFLKIYSIQPYFYTDKLHKECNNLFSKQNQIKTDENFYFNQSNIFYSTLILEFLQNLFKTTIISPDSNLIENIYYKFRKEILTQFDKIRKNSKDSLNLKSVKKLLNSIYSENGLFKEIISYYEFFGNRHSDDSHMENSEFDKSINSSCQKSYCFDREKESDISKNFVGNKNRKRSFISNSNFSELQDFTNQTVHLMNHNMTVIDTRHF